MRERGKHVDHDLADPLLPWFVNGTLTRFEHELVARHAADCDECKGNIALLASVRNAVCEANPTPMVPQSSPDTLMEAIDTRQKERRRWRVGWAAAASFAALLVMSTILMSMRDRSPALPLRFETATSEADPPPMNYVLSVRFEDGTSTVEQERLLQGIGASDISTTDEAYVYRVVVALPASSLEDLERYTKKLEALPDVQAVQAVALQIPVNKPQ